MNMHYPDPQDLEEDDGWECPTCLRPMQDEHDYECGTCEAKASEHLRVTTLCKLLRETQRRESLLIVERDKLKRELAEARGESFQVQAWKQLTEQHRNEMRGL